LVKKDSEGLKTEKMEHKMSCRMTQNTNIFMTNVFVPNNMRLAKARDF